LLAERVKSSYRIERGYFFCALYSDYDILQPMKQTALKRKWPNNVMTANGREPVAIKAVTYAFACVLILVCLVGIALYVVEGLSLFRLGEVGFGDSYILYDVLHFQKTGLIYRDLSRPPYQPAQYSPLVYILYSTPGRIVHSRNPFMAPRLMVIAAFLLCIAIATSIVRTLIATRHAWIWGILLPFSTLRMSYWILQLRGDFPGIVLSLLSIRLLLSDIRWAVPLAGVCAGFAMQFKITLIAAAGAGALWLLAQRRWKDFVRFAVPSCLFSAGPYLLYSLREPRMLGQIFALSPGITNVTGNLELMDKAVLELLILLALPGLASIQWRTWPKETLVVLFAATSLAVAGLTDMQAGGNINYYFELFFAVVPIGVLGVFRLMELARRSAVLGLALTSVLAIHSLAPALVTLHANVGLLRNGWIDSSNAELEQVEHALTGHRFFSTVPRIALLDPEPPLIEPYLLAYMHRLGKVDLRPFVEPIRQNEYDVVITNAFVGTWRGIDHLDPTLREAIASSYRVHCKFGSWLFHLPKDVQANSILAQKLRTIGCSALPANAETKW
jgi:hypothetical protein